MIVHIVIVEHIILNYSTTATHICLYINHIYMEHQTSRIRLV